MEAVGCLFEYSCEGGPLWVYEGQRMILGSQFFSLSGFVDQTQVLNLVVKTFYGRENCGKKVIRKSHMPGIQKVPRTQ